MMLNQLVLVGRVATISDKDDEKIIMTLNVNCLHENSDGEYDHDIISVSLKGQFTDQVKEYCHEGDIVGIKGHIERLSLEPMEIVADKVTFLSSSKND